MVCFIGQIIFSIYYSITIVDNNSQYNQQQDQLQVLNTNNQHLQVEAAKLKSLPELLRSAKLKIPIESTIDLSQ